jgi:hypothetical protein
MASDYDNPVKIFQDVLSKKYGFNDNRIFAGHQYKILVPKGEEFINLFSVAIIAKVLFDKTWILLWHIFYPAKPYSQTKALY